jgi:small subunit ribosomal protein S3
MGQKVHPYGMRLGIIRDWQSTWFAEEGYREFLLEDIRLRQFIRRQADNAGISRIHIERKANTIAVTIHTAKPGVVIGRGGRGVERLRQQLEEFTGRKVHVNVEEVKEPDLDAQLVAESIASQIERRVSFRRAMKQAIVRCMRAGALGARVTAAGRLGGAEIAHSEVYRSPEGRVPLHTFRADVDYGFAEARTGYGRIGIKVWLYKGEVMPPPKKTVEREREAPVTQQAEPVVAPAAVPAVEEAAPQADAMAEPPALEPVPQPEETMEPAAPVAVAPTEEAMATDADAQEDQIP